MFVAPEDFNALIARVFDGAIMVDGARVIAHKSGIHVVRAAQQPSARTQPIAPPPQLRPLDRDNDWSEV